ncbi:hypothetical protein I5M27_02335 [Adhaeribacter sp. BT258]|uniref:Protein argonaute n=1 Tax=Adhaeribacter terrigena TaxID=2793070 RepID=A0ABS1BXE2_9BACT|nr:hypothetical protein [Adhaeribacter terrigena]MBK0401803.1 hypothetical protein [Adhaeribacter terrigena]
MKVELLKEPLLEFGNDFLCDDPKTGITVGGFFSLTNKTHRTELHYALIGTNNGIEAAIDWLKSFEDEIEASPKDLISVDDFEINDGQVVQSESEYQLFDTEIDSNATDRTTFEQSKRLNPNFPGFRTDSIFECEFVNDDANNKVVKEISISNILNDKEIDPLDKAIRVADLYVNAYKEIIEDSISKPTVCFLIIPAKVYDKFSSVRYHGNHYFNLRRYLKAQLISIPNSIPVQIILEDTLTGKKKSLQDLSMQAWNFIVANYYKTSATPWTLTLKDKHTCFIGISFHKVLDSDSNVLRSSIAQAFDYEGKGVIFIGKQFEWNSKLTNTAAPHLTHDYAQDLIKKVLLEYKKYHKNQMPTRVVIHKTTDFWNVGINQEYAEVEGFKSGIHELLGEDVEIDLVTLKGSNIKLLRTGGIYPPVRGTLLHLNQQHGILYTTGYIPYYETFPGVHFPKAIEVEIFEGESTLKKVCDEIMALTKMNFNNCSYYDSLPITIRFAQKVGEIIQYIDDGVIPPNKYYYYM